MGIEAKWQPGGMSFNVGTASGHSVVLDASPKVGGANLGPRPTEMLLAGLACCGGIDVVSILNKMRVGLTRCDISVDGDRAEEHPHRFTSIRVDYTIEAAEATDAKVQKAIILSRDKYCSVAATLNSHLIYRYRLNGGNWVDLSAVKLEA